jgi:hypothetical protein
MWCHAPEGPPMHHKKCSVKSFVPYCGYEQDKPFFVLLFFYIPVFKINDYEIQQWTNARLLHAL